MTKGNFLITFSLAMTTALCLMGNQDLLFNAYGYHLLLLSKLVMLWSATLASLAILTVIRAHSLEFLFGGLDNAVIIHRKLGIACSCGSIKP
jgi:predicted ferric reductase